MFDVLPALGACLRTQLGTLTMAFAAGERERHVTRNAVRVIQNALSAPPGEDTCRSGYRPVEFHTNSIENFGRETAAIQPNKASAYSTTDSQSPRNHACSISSQVACGSMVRLPVPEREAGRSWCREPHGRRLGARAAKAWSMHRPRQRW